MAIRKPISFVVILALVLGLFSITAFAGSTATTTTAAPAATSTSSAVTTTTPAVTATPAATTAPAVKTTPAATTAPAVTTTPAATTAPAVTAPAATTAPAVTTPAAKEATALPTASKVLVNAKTTSFDAYNINGNNYFKLRDLASSLNATSKHFEVKWDASKNAINLVSNSTYSAIGGEMGKNDGKSQKATLSTSKIYMDGKEMKLTAYNIGGYNYFKLRDVAQAFNIGITFDSKTNTISIDTDKAYVAQ